MLTGYVFRSGIECELRTSVTTISDTVAIYRESAWTLVISASAVGVRPILLLFICAGTAVLGSFEVHSNEWLTVDTLSARLVRPDDFCPREMRSRVT